MKKLLALLLLLAGCNAGPNPATVANVDKAAIQSAIEAQLAKLVPIAQKKDANGFAALFTEDATWIVPGASAFVGRAAIEASVKTIMASPDSVTVSAPSIIDRLIVVNDSEAVIFAHQDFTVTTKGKTSAQVDPYADYWKKGSDGVWRIAYEVNSVGPAPQQTAAPAGKK